MLSLKVFDSFLHIQSDAGEIKVVNPYHPHWFHFFSMHNAKGTQRGQIKGENVYTSQLRAFANAINNQTILTTLPEDAVNNMRVIDAIYEKAGLQLRGK
jgi:predicted dehydrogenase